MAYDPGTGQLVLFGGANAEGNPVADTWTWDGSTWTQASPANSPPARFYASMAYDPGTGQLVLFGGTGSSFSDLADTWTWNGSTWTQATPAAAPSARDRASMAYDPAAGQLVLFGGIDGSLLADTWLVGPPTAPGSLTATSGAGQISLAWQAPSWPGTSGITRYEIFRGTSPGGEAATPIATVSAATTSYTDTSGTILTTYYYTIEAVNAAGASAASNEASAAPLNAQAITFTSSPPSPADYGASYGPSASSSSGLAVTLSIDASSTPGACALSAGLVSFTGTGTCVVDANQAGSSVYAPAPQVQQSFTIAKAATTTSVIVTATDLVAAVAVSPPGGGIAAGTVAFTVNGIGVGTATLNASGVATLAYASSGAETVTASYAGTADYQASAGSAATTNPLITAAPSSTYPKTSYGWYRSPVTITFTCTPGSAPLTGPCPGPVTLGSNGAGQQVTRTISGTDGGTAAVTITVSIDQAKPALTVTGIKNKASYDAPGPAKIGCKATEAISGLAGPCKLTIKRTETEITWTATATSKAGVTTTVKCIAHLIDFYVAGAKLVKGRYLVTDGRRFTVKAYVLGATKAPRLLIPARGAKPGRTGPALKKAGHSLWAVTITITTRKTGKTQEWTVAILTGKTRHIIHLSLKT